MSIILNYMSDKPKSVLQLKTQKKIQHVLLDLFSESEMSLGGKSFLISVTNVDISPDLRNLKIYIDIINMDMKNRKKVVKNLNKENIYVIKNVLAKKLNLRYVPEPLFIVDDSNEKLYRMNKIIDEESKKFE